MSTCAQQVVEAVKALLLNATAADSRVYTDRLWPFDEGRLPALRVYDDGEELEPVTVHWPQLRQHELMVDVELCAKAASGIDATLAALRLAAEQALFVANGTLGLAGVDATVKSLGPLEPVEHADLQIAKRTLRIQARYRSFANTPDTFA